MAVTKLSNSGIATGGVLKYDSMLAGNPAFTPGTYYQIATQTVGAGGAANITFNSIPSTYKQLEIRFKAKSEYNTGNDILLFTANGVSSAYWTIIYGANSGTNTSGYTANYSAAGFSTTPPFSNDAWAMGVLTFSDYTNTNKFRVAEGYSGWVNGISTGSMRFYHVECRNTITAITSLTFVTDSGSDLAQGSQFSLYGIG